MYHQEAVKTEPELEPLAGPSEGDGDAEYLDEDLGFGDGKLLNYYLLYTTYYIAAKCQ